MTLLTSLRWRDIYSQITTLRTPYEFTDFLDKYKKVLQLISQKQPQAFFPSLNQNYIRCIVQLKTLTYNNSSSKPGSFEHHLLLRIFFTFLRHSSFFYLGHARLGLFPKYKNELQNGVHSLATSPLSLSVLEMADLTTLADIKVLDFCNRLQRHEPRFAFYYEPKLLGITPHRNCYLFLEQVWVFFRDLIREQTKTGSLHPLFPDSSAMRSKSNTAENVPSLLIDANLAAPMLEEVAQKIAAESDGKALFGPNKMYLKKSEGSIRGKVARNARDYGHSEQRTLKDMDDVVRGTISVDTPEQIFLATRALLNTASAGQTMAINDLWHRDGMEQMGGYVDIDANLALRSETAANTCTVIGELQIHFSEFFNGTNHCFVARNHKIYEISRMIGTPEAYPINISQMELNYTSLLYFTTALFQITANNNLIPQALKKTFY